MAVSDHISLFILTIGRTQSRSTVHACVRVFFHQSECYWGVCVCVTFWMWGKWATVWKNANIFHLHSIFIYSSRKSFRVKLESLLACRQPLWSWAILSNRNAVRLFTRPATQAEIHFCSNQAVAVWQDTMQVWASCVNNSKCEESSGAVEPSTVTPVQPVSLHALSTPCPLVVGASERTTCRD